MILFWVLGFQETLNEFSGTAWPNYPEDKAYWSQNPDPTDSGLPMTIDSQSIICGICSICLQFCFFQFLDGVGISCFQVDSPSSEKNQIGQEKASGGGSSGSSDEGISNLIDPKREKR